MTTVILQHLNFAFYTGPQDAEVLHHAKDATQELGNVIIKQEMNASLQFGP